MSSPELQKTRPHGAVLAWFRAVAEETIFLPAIVPAELQTGINRVRLQPPDRAASLDTWLDDLPQSYQVLALDGTVCREWARMMRGRSGALTGDAFVAATAKVHGLNGSSRNVKDFADFGVNLLDPFSGLEISVTGSGRG